VHECVDLVVAERAGLLGGLQLGGEGEIARLPALGGHQLFHGAALAGAGIADIDALALQVIESLHDGVGARDHAERRGRANIFAIKL
jgi:hypothetical protein